MARVTPVTRGFDSASVRASGAQGDWATALSLFARRIGINPADTETLALLRNVRTFAKSFSAGELLIERHQNLNDVYLIKSGWACAHLALPDGRRQILNLLMPGDVTGLLGTVSNQAIFGVEALCPMEAVVLPLSILRNLADSNPRLANSIEWLIAHEQSILSEHLLSLGCRVAMERLLHLMLELWWRLERVGLAGANTFHLPVTQATLGEVTGLTPVHVNRSLRRLKEHKLLEVDRNRVRILDRLAAQRACEFDSAYLE